MTQRVIDNPGAVALSQHARSMSSIEPALNRTGEAFVIFLLSIRIPRLGMKSQPDLAFLFPLSPQMSRNGITQPKCDEIHGAALLPMRQEILREPNLLVRIKEAQCIHCDHQGVTASKPSQLPRRLGSRRSLEHQLAHVFHRWAAVGNHLVVVFLEVKSVAKFLLLGSA
jgi:hypothetical protein